MIPLISKVIKHTETEGRMVAVGGWGQGDNGELLFTGHRVSIWEDENILEMDNGDGCTTL